MDAMSGRSERDYTHGYSAAAVSEMANRTADSHAAFFLPYLSESSHVLDCGSGPGSISIGVAQRVPAGRVTGIDIDPGQVKIATDRAISEAVSNVEFRQASLYEIPFGDDAYDAVFAHAVLEHIRHPLDVLKEMFRVLKPGGIVALRHPVVSSRVWSPPAPPEVQRAEAMWIEQWRRNGGDPDFGKNQAKLMATVGFKIVSTSSSARHLDRNHLIQRTRLGGEAGLMTPLGDIGVPPSDVPAIVKAFTEWLADEAACNSMLMMETIGRK